MCIAIVCFPGCDVINFETNFIFLIKQLFWMAKKSRQKSKEQKELLKSNKKHFSAFLKVLKLYQTWEFPHLNMPVK